MTSSSRRLALIDMGTNTFHLLIATLEPGTVPRGRAASPTDRIGDLAGHEPASTSSFIAAARRAAQAAAASVRRKRQGRGFAAHRHRGRQNR